MKTIRKVTMVAATLFLAAATGQVVQNGGPFSSHEPDTTADLAGVPTDITSLSARSDQPAVLPNLPDAMAVLPARPVELASRLPDSGGIVRSGTSGASQSAETCAMELSIESAPAAMLSLHLNAPCRANERVVIRHEGLAITGRTSDSGQMEAQIPAFANEAAVVVAFSGGASVSAGVTVPDMADFDRVGIQWQGADAFELNALEFGATEGNPGHVSAVDPRNPAYGDHATGGFLSILGDGDVALPMLAEVYSFPARRSFRDGTVRLYIEATVTPATCNREMLAETLDLREGGAVRLVDLSLSMPGCDALGQFLVLKNLLPDMKIARN